MTDYTVKRLALTFAVQAEVEAKKAENEYRRHRGYAPSYYHTHFIALASNLKKIARAEDYELLNLKL